MNTEPNYKPEEEKEQKTSAEEKGDTTQKDTEISLPRIDRPEGPFEHSGETAGWTKEEKEEKTEQDRQPGNDG